MVGYHKWVLLLWFTLPLFPFLCSITCGTLRSLPVSTDPCIRCPIQLSYLRDLPSRPPLRGALRGFLCRGLLLTLSCPPLSSRDSSTVSDFPLFFLFSVYTSVVDRRSGTPGKLVEMSCVSTPFPAVTSPTTRRPTSSLTEVFLLLVEKKTLFSILLTLFLSPL